jgi:hypothetical protein
VILMAAIDAMLVLIALLIRLAWLSVSRDNEGSA